MALPARRLAWQELDPLARMGLPARPPACVAPEQPVQLGRLRAWERRVASPIAPPLMPRWQEKPKSK